MSNIYYWEKLTFSNLSFSKEKNLKICAGFEEQNGTRYIRWNVYYGIIVFSYILSTNPCLIFLLICFTQEIKGFYQSSLGNEVENCLEATQLDHKTKYLEKNKISTDGLKKIIKNS